MRSTSDAAAGSPEVAFVAAETPAGDAFQVGDSPASKPVQSHSATRSKLASRLAAGTSQPR